MPLSAQDANECKEKCKNSGTCQWFTYRNQEKFCILLQDCSSVTNNGDDTCTSGSIDDECQDECDDTTDGCCLGNVLGFGNANDLSVVSFHGFGYGNDLGFAVFNGFGCGRIMHQIE